MGLEPGVAGGGHGLRRLGDDILQRREIPGLEQRERELQQQLDPPGLCLAEQRRGAGEQVLRGRHVPARVRAPAGRGQDAGGALAQRLDPRRRRARARARAGAPARGGSRRSPRTPSPGRSRASRSSRRDARAASARTRFGQRSIGGVANEDVREAERSPPRPRPRTRGWNSSLRMSECRQRVSPGCSSGGASSATARHMKTRPTTEARSTTGALVGRQPIQARGEQRMDGGRDRDARDVVDRAPAVLGALQQAVVDEHAQRLLDEERVALRHLGDPFHCRPRELDVAPGSCGSVRRSRPA